MNTHEVLKLMSQPVYSVTVLGAGIGTWPVNLYYELNPKRMRVYDEFNYSGVTKQVMQLVGNNFRSIPLDLLVESVDSMIANTHDYSQDLVWITNEVTDVQLDNIWKKIRPTCYMMGTTNHEQIENFCHRNKLRNIKSGSDWIFYKPGCCACTLTEDPIGAYANAPANLRNN